ncbi:MAG: methyltransferase domain-containing protein [Gammaproteobacteria bacterium]|nr:methyltransferase domain-containing protein [Gammaproteobacteria bacterium]
MVTRTQQAAPTPVPEIDERELHELLGRVIVDFGGASVAHLVLIGDRLGLYRALAEGEPVTSAELAKRTGTHERYVREWLNAQAASFYVSYDAQSGRYFMTPEQAAVFADEDSPAFAVGGYQTAVSAGRVLDRLTEAFRTGEGIGWHEHDHGVFHGVERFYRSSYVGQLVQQWIPSLDGVEAKLEAGARVADVGCGHGASTILMAQAFPESEFIGFDYHEESIAQANARAKRAGVGDRCRFEVAGAKDFPGGNYDLVTVFDALHDMGDPAGASRHVLGTLAPDGSWMIVEPYAGDRVEENLTPVGRAFYAASTLICTPCSLAQEVGLALGAQAGEGRMRAVVTGAGFTRFRRALATPFNLIYEARP